MSGPPDQAKRLDLINRVRAYLIRNGLADLSLRPLARALGTSDRMLLYYFGTKEGMVAEALALDERRPLLRARDMLEATDSTRDPAGVRRFMEETWQQFRAPGLRPALRLYVEIMAASLIHSDGGPSPNGGHPAGRRDLRPGHRLPGRGRPGPDRRGLPRSPRPPRTRLARQLRRVLTRAISGPEERPAKP
ncbi:TetR/AcrR family transcriptional regulator [Streptomyces sp. NPDC005251]|uniref:TetR/AcrR family transcriptional regulator n=1 Tax=Streptomyces sp. NPDC005251 TaxID=3157166 RepID=UPI0033BD4F8E